MNVVEKKETVIPKMSCWWQYNIFEYTKKKDVAVRPEFTVLQLSHDNNNQLAL